MFITYLRSQMLILWQILYSGKEFGKSHKDASQGSQRLQMQILW